MNTMNIFKEKWREMPQSRRWLGALILAMFVTVGVLGISQSVATEKKSAVDPVPKMHNDRSDPFNFSDFMDREYWDAFNHDPFERMKTMREKMDRLFNGDPFSGFNNDPFFRQGLITSSSDGFGYRSISEFKVRMEDAEVVVTGTLLGGDKSNVEVTVEDRQLRIAARIDGQEQETRKKEDLGSMTRRSQFSSRFEKWISLPDNVTPAGMKTELHDGLLTVRIPRMTGS
ncbi:MAG: Hsp20/alpha crystallin family protein [Magnetococcales bacterium]|nr:Hsp20/alpha crystallin family protein [Magnetococcales bacterium]